MSRPTGWPGFTVRLSLEGITRAARSAYPEPTVVVRTTVDARRIQIQLRMFACGRGKARREMGLLGDDRVGQRVGVAGGAGARGVIVGYDVLELEIGRHREKGVLGDGRAPQVLVRRGDRG